MSAPVLQQGAPGSQRRPQLVLLLGVLAALLLLPAAPAAAEELVVTITSDGVQPQVLVARPGDTVRFVNEDRSFAYRAQSTGGPWSFDSGPTTLLTDDFAVPVPLTTAGTYAYRVAQDPPYRGTVLLGGGTPSAAPASAPPPAALPSAGSAPAAAPTAAGATPGAVTPVPVTPAPLTSTAGTPAPVPSVGPAAVPGALPGAPSGRGLGLPTALAAVLVLGAGSLLVRLLLAEPVLSQGPARLRRTGTAAPRW